MIDRYLFQAIKNSIDNLEDIASEFDFIKRDMERPNKRIDALCNCALDLVCEGIERLDNCETYEEILFEEALIRKNIIKLYNILCDVYEANALVNLSKLEDMLYDD